MDAELLKEVVPLLTCLSVAGLLAVGLLGFRGLFKMIDRTHGTQSWDKISPNDGWRVK